MEDVPSHARLAAPGRVKNKAPAKVQITAEQLLREAWERKESGPSAAPKQQITDLEELQEYQRTERKQFEMRIVRNRSHTPLWQRYARWEEAQEEFPRARSVWERAIDNDYRNPAIWLGYVEMEMRHRFVNHARNVFDRAVALLPRVDQLWLKYAHMEEMLGQMDLARLVYSRWLKWLPGVSAFFAAIRFELRQGETEGARRLYEQLAEAHRTAHSYIKYAKFEERLKNYARARHVYERATTELSELHLTAGFFLSFAKFEERRKQPARARVIYNYALSKLPKDAANELHRAFTTFEKQQQDREILDDLLVRKKREEFDEALSANPIDYDTWFDLLQLEEAHGKPEQIRKTYERAVCNIPPSATKFAWRRYIYLWISYAVWAELSADSAKEAVAIYGRCVASIPKKHKAFSFGKVWLLYAQAHLRAGDANGARRALGTGIGVLPDKERLYRAYVEMETALGEIGRARSVYQAWLERQPRRGDVWLELAKLEQELDEEQRVLAVLRLAVDMPEVSHLHELWQRLIEVESDSGAAEEHMLQLFERFIAGCQDAAAWLSLTRYLMGQASKQEACREAFARAARAMKGRTVEGGPERETHAEGLREVVAAWVRWEESVEVGGETQSEREERVAKVMRMMPTRVKKKRAVVGAHGAHGGWEEYWQTVLPEERVDVAARKDLLLAAARKWKLEKAGAG